MGELRTVIDLILMLIGFGIFIGMYRAKIGVLEKANARLEKRIEKHEDECKAQRESDRREDDQSKTNLHEKINKLAIEVAKK